MLGCFPRGWALLIVVAESSAGSKGEPVIHVALIHMGALFSDGAPAIWGLQHIFSHEDVFPYGRLSIYIVYQLPSLYVYHTIQGQNSNK